MKLYCVSADDYEKQASVLEEYRRQGNMVFLYGDCSRACMKRRHIREANVFAADGGEFVFSGCYSLFESRSGYLAEITCYHQYSDHNHECASDQHSIPDYVLMLFYKIEQAGCKKTKRHERQYEPQCI